MYRLLCLLIGLMLVAGAGARTVVVDASTGEPLCGASVFGKNGTMAGICSDRGVIPYVSPSDYPLTIRCMGYVDAVCKSPADSLVAMTDVPYELPEIVVEKSNRVLHILAYVRDYSTLSTYTDTVTMYRDKWVDFMLPVTKLRRFKGWNEPRIITSKSYYRFTDRFGLDSVSNRTNHHFSWSDWIEIPDEVSLPARLHGSLSLTDTVYGKYSPTEIWVRKDDDLRLTVDVLADTASRRWVPRLGAFFSDDVDFENFHVSYDFRSIARDRATARDQAHISCNIESRGRGHKMFMFNRRNEPFFVSTYTEFYIVDKSFITLKEAKRWEKENFAQLGLELTPPADIVPEVSPDIAELIERVNTADYYAQRLKTAPDQRYVKKLPPLTSAKRIGRLFRSLIPFQKNKSPENKFMDKLKHQQGN